ncbi:MAG: CoA transferase [Pseudomonadota bacterium]
MSESGEREASDRAVGGPLDGVTVVDLTSMVSGPLAAMILADQGATVWKVEAPGGDYSRDVATRRGGFSASFLNNNRNKKSVVLDLKQKAGREALLKLAAGADVFLQNFRPGVAERLGLGEAAIRAAAPKVIYASIAGFGFDGPYAQKPVFDPLIQALSGLTTVQAGSDEARPRLVRTILPDKLTGVQMAQAICAALYHRERSGCGQHIRLSMLDAVVAFLWHSDMGARTFIGDEPEREEAQSYIDLIYEVADGYVSVAAMQDKHWEGLARATERLDLLRDPRFETPMGREIHKEARLTLTQEALAPFRRDDILARLEAQDVPCAPVLTRAEMIAHPQIAANDLLREAEHPAAGRLRQTRPAPVFSAAPAERLAPAPALGEHTREALAAAGYADEAIETLLACGAAQAPLRGSARVDDAADREDAG